MGKKKKNEHDEHINESWLIPYADLLTLLLALFIVLFASSQIDQKKFQEIARAFSNAFAGGTGVLEFQSPVEPITPPAQDEEGRQQEKQPSPAVSEQEKEGLAQVKEKIDVYIRENKLGGKLQTSLTDEGLAITILDDILFDSGSAEVHMKDRRLAAEISTLLVMNPPRNIIISGHTDNVPIHNEKFASNWELSVMRAVNFMKVLLENKQLDPRYFSAKGYGEYKPIASNATAAGRMKNRRVEILILPRTELNHP
ncbi:flagellar motor protein MotB [Geobacillus subterraneus]|uniref:Flagellar motor protein MotB n=2 Tax=Geobacillus TaxID=129337 RepID=A0ABN4NIR0_9BACL|nr:MULTISPECIES: flagellar motor protein MotB [Geobacillus]AMX82820.1 flagellar motor protein MotB [Geobacillus subterraneus]KZS26102.1 flagellar motor protein MotB [Geobacillus subterraneus]OXB90911.1 flagellar motor protein MotB [Geobacillus uzenensis]QIZ68448.1 flagellar motor protein MotB [Geobacillus subterraneus]